MPAFTRLRAGGAVVVRRVDAEDTDALRLFFRDLSPSSRYRRFLRALRELPEEMLARFTHPDPAREAVLVASLPHSRTHIIIGMAQYVGTDAVKDSEIAVVVSDSWQRQGLGYQLLDALLNIAAEAGIERVHADILADNHAMRQLAHKLGCEIAVNPAAPYLVCATKVLASRDRARSDEDRLPMHPSRHANLFCSPTRAANEKPKCVEDADAFAPEYIETLASPSRAAGQGVR